MEGVLFKSSLGIDLVFGREHKCQFYAVYEIIV